jgi:hypothetical protein
MPSDRVLTLLLDLAVRVGLKIEKQFGALLSWRAPEIKVQLVDNLV